VLDDFCPKQAFACAHLQTEKPKSIGQKSRRFILLNLEPHIHFSKSLLPGKIPDKNPAKCGSVYPEKPGQTDPNSTQNQPQQLG
jgi:hypothetical protein